jgi:hypothetical protein
MIKNTRKILFAGPYFKLSLSPFKNGPKAVPAKVSDRPVIATLWKQKSVHVMLSEQKASGETELEFIKLVK